MQIGCCSVQESDAGWIQGEGTSAGVGNLGHPLFCMLKSCFSFEDRATAVMVTSGWQEEEVNGRVEWRYAYTEYGALCAASIGMYEMLLLSAVN